MPNATQRRPPETRIATSSPFLKMTRLPDGDLQGRWDRLIGIDATKILVLRYFTAGEFLAQKKLSKEVARGNIILIAGPPGTGKTDLALGCGHRFAVKNGEPAVLLEVDAHQLPSANKGGTQQNIVRLFRDIAEVAASDLPVIVVVNEVETIAGSRADLAPATNPADTANSVNAVIESLDTVAQDWPNVRIFVTCNRPKALDRAVLDRCDFTITTKLPNAAAREAILLDALVPVLEAVARHRRDGNGADRQAGGCGRGAMPELPAVVRKSEGLSPRELRKLVIRGLSLAETPADFTTAHLELAVDDYLAQREHHRANGGEYLDDYRPRPKRRQPGHRHAARPDGVGVPDDGRAPDPRHA